MYVRRNVKVTKTPIMLTQVEFLQCVRTKKWVSDLK